MRAEEFDYDLPAHAIAQTPVEPRDAARLLVATDEPTRHLRVHDLPSLVGPGDLVVVNETRVAPARVVLHKSTGGEVEVFLLGPLDAGRWDALVRPGRRVPPGTTLLADGRPVVEVGEDLDDGRRAVRPLVPIEALHALGTVPLPPYIERPLEDPDRYQTVFARDEAHSAAAPTAGLHLTSALLDQIRQTGAKVATVDLTVGLATFRPLATDEVADHHMHAEHYAVPDDTLAACRNAGRVIAVGTTTVRALESAARGDPEGSTSLFIRDPFDFRVVDLLLTNFHLPRSSLLVLLHAFAGPRWRALYDEALREGYRFLSFGDCMLVGRS